MMELSEGYLNCSCVDLLMNGQCDSLTTYCSIFDRAIINVETRVRRGYDMGTPNNFVAHGNNWTFDVGHLHN